MTCLRNWSSARSDSLGKITKFDEDYVEKNIARYFGSEAYLNCIVGWYCYSQPEDIAKPVHNVLAHSSNPHQCRVDITVENKAHMEYE